MVINQKKDDNDYNKSNLYTNKRIIIIRWRFKIIIIVYNFIGCILDD